MHLQATSCTQLMILAVDDVKDISSSHWDPSSDLSLPNWTMHQFRQFSSGEIITLQPHRKGLECEMTNWWLVLDRADGMVL